MSNTSYTTPHTASDCSSSLSSTSILSQPASIPMSISPAPPSEKQELDALLNNVMCQLHTKFGQNDNQQINQEIHKKLNALKLLVSQIEQRAKQKHVEIDLELDKAQSALKKQTKLQHAQLEKQKNDKLSVMYSQVKNWISSNLADQNTHNMNSNMNHTNHNNHNNNGNNICATNGSNNIVIITDSNNNVMNAFIYNNNNEKK